MTSLRCFTIRLSHWGREMQLHIPAPSIFWLEKNEQYASFQKQSSLDTYARFCTAQIIRKGEKQNALDH